MNVVRFDLSSNNPTPFIVSVAEWLNANVGGLFDSSGVFTDESPDLLEECECLHEQLTGERFNTTNFATGYFKNGQGWKLIRIRWESDSFVDGYRAPDKVVLLVGIEDAALAVLFKLLHQP